MFNTVSLHYKQWLIIAIHGIAIIAAPGFKIVEYQVIITSYNVAS